MQWGRHVIIANVDKIFFIHVNNDLIVGNGQEVSPVF